MPHPKPAQPLVGRGGESNEKMGGVKWVKIAMGKLGR